MENIVHLEKEPWKVSKDEHKNILLHPGTLWSPTPSNQEVSAHRRIAGLLRKKSLILFSFEIDDISRSPLCQFVDQRTSLLFSIFVSYTIPKTTESKNKLPLYFTHFCISLRYDISYKKKIFSKIGVKEKLSNHLNWMELLMIIFAEYTSVYWELGEDKLDLLSDNFTRPLLYFQHGIFVDFKHDCISMFFNVLQCYLHLRFFRCAVALVWISSFILALPVIWTNVSFCHLKMRNI